MVRKLSLSTPVLSAALNKPPKAPKPPTKAEKKAEKFSKQIEKAGDFDSAAWKLIGFNTKNLVFTSKKHKITKSYVGFINRYSALTDEKRTLEISTENVRNGELDLIKYKNRAWEYIDIVQGSEQVPRYDEHTGKELLVAVALPTVIKYLGDASPEEKLKKVKGFDDLDVEDAIAKHQANFIAAKKLLDKEDIKERTKEVKLLVNFHTGELIKNAPASGALINEKLFPFDEFEVKLLN